jgi:hypothetical protein
LLIFILLLQQFGCVSLNTISTANLPAYSPKYAYAIHCHKSVYVLQKIAVVNDTLSGKIYNPQTDVLATGKMIRIYLSSDSLVKISPTNILSLPLSGITKVQTVEEDSGKTTALVLGSIGLVLLLLAGIALSSMSVSFHI